MADDVPLQPDDRFLIEQMLAGDSAALDRLMSRYDKLVRFAIFRVSRERCGKDPQWLDSIASETWAGFVQSMQRTHSESPASVGSYLVRIARNRCISAIRGESRRPIEYGIDETSAADQIEVSMEDPADAVAQLEETEALRGCIESLSPDEQGICKHIPAIMDRRWRAVAAAEDTPESTIRSRWKRVIGRLTACMRQKTGRNFAPKAARGDS